MIKFGKKVRQTLTMLLAVSMLAGSVPMNTFAMEGESGMTQPLIEAVSENTVETEVVMDNTGLEEVVGELPVDENTSFQEEILAELEETIVSSNETKIAEEVAAAETGEKVDITFTVSQNSDTSYVKIIQIDEESLETEVTGYKVSAEVGKALKFRLELAKGYKVTKVTMGNSILPEVEGVYTTYPAAAGDIEITVAEVEKYDVTFEYDDKLVTDLKVKMGGKDVTLQENVAVGMWEGSTVSFTLTLDSMAKVVKVTANEEELKAVDGTTYELQNLKEEVVIKIDTSLDGKKCNTLDIVVWGHQNSVSVLNDGVMYTHGKRLLSKDSNEEITVYLDNNYVVDKILLNNVEKKFTGTNTSYSVTFSKENKNQTLIIYTTPKVSTEKKKLVFANKASNITYEVNRQDPSNPDRIIVEKDAYKNNTYTVSANEILMEFSVTAKDGYEPNVIIPEGVLYDVSIKGNTRTYSVAVTTLGNEQTPTEIIIEEIAQPRTILVVYDANALETLKTIIDGGVRNPDEKSYDGTKKLTTQKFIVTHGTDIVLELKTVKGYTVGTIKEVEEEDVLKVVKPGKEEYEYTIKADRDKTVELQLDGTYVTRVYDVFDEENVFEVEEKKGTYSVEAGRKYQVCLYNGKDMMWVTSAVLKNGTKVVEDDIKVVDSVNVYLEIQKTEAGKSLTLELNSWEGNRTHTHIMKIKVLPEVKITKITGVKSGKLSQTADTVKEYKFTGNVAFAKDQLGVEVVTAKAEEDIIDEEQREELNEAARAAFEAELEEDVLKITVKTSKKGEKAYVKFYDVSKSTADKKHYITGGTILVTAKAPAFHKKATPGVSLKSATNLNLILNLSMKNVEEIGNGEYWYKIEGTPKYSSKTDESVIDNTEEFVQYVKYTGASQTASVQVISALEEGELPYKADFDIKVTFVQTADKEEPMESEEDATAGNVAFWSKTSAKKTMSTKVPSYETKLGIKMRKKTVYTGQQNVVVATPVFSKATTYQQISCVAKEEGIEVAVDENNQILVSAGAEVEPGEYTIKVTAQAAENTVAAVKEFTFRVAQGIYEIALDTPKELYKGYQKKATLKVGITYNEKEEEKQPETKKVQWRLLDAEEVEIDEEHPLYKIFTIKNGVVTIAREFIVSQEETENTFYVEAIAMDYEREEGEEIIGRSAPIIITNKKITLGEMVLVEPRETEEGMVYDVVARSGQDAPIDKVNGSQIVILHKGTPERDVYTEEDFMYGIAEEEDENQAVLVYSSNKKKVEIGKDKTIKAESIIKDVKITAKTEDGSGVKSEISGLNIVYAQAGNLGIEVRTSENGLTIADTYVSGTTKFYGAKDQALTLKILEEVKGNSEAAYGRDYQLKVTGAQIVESERVDGIYQLVATSDTIVVELLNNTTEVNKIFTLKNVAFANKEVKNSKELTLKVEGVLQTGERTKEQTICYTLPKESRKKYTHAWVTVDKLDYLNEKKTEYYDALIAASNGTIGSLQQLGSDGKVYLTFKVPEGEESYYIPDKNFTYKFNISFGTVTDDYEFVAQVKSNPVTIKTQKDKLPASPMQASYAISAKEDGSALLALKNKKYSLLEVGTLMNKNVKGVQNRFSEYFEVVAEEKEDESREFFIRLKSDVDVREIKKTDMEGYISEYTFATENKTKTVYNAPVKISLKDLVRKYSLTKAVVLLEDEETVEANVKILAGNKEVVAGEIYVPQNQKFDVSINGDGSLNLQSKDEAKIKASNKCTVYVVPEYSCYASQAEEVLGDSELLEKSESAFLKKLGKYAIKLTADITVKNKANATGKIKFTSKALKVKLTAEDFKDGAYLVEIPYSKVAGLDVESFVNQSEESMVSVAKSTETDSITLRLEKQALAEAYAKDKKIYGKTISVKAVAEFGTDTKEEVITFKVTLPKKPVQLQEAVDTLKKVVWSDLPIQYKGLGKEEIETINSELILEKAKEVFSVDGDLSAELQEFAAQPSTKETEGKLTGKLIVTDEVKGDRKKVEIAITLEKLLTQPEELEGNLQDAIAYCEGRKITNLTTLSGILTTIRSRVSISEYKNLRLYAKNTQTTPATITNAGSISGIFCIIDITNKEAAQLEVPFAFEIPQLMTMEQAAEEVKAAVEEIILYNKDLLSVNKEATIEKILKVAGEVLAGQDYFVELKRGTTLNGTPAGGSEEGSASIQLEIVYLTTERLFKDITCVMQVLETKE